VEGFAISEVSLPEMPLPPKGRQPAFGISVFTYFLDIAANFILALKYRKHTREKT
jgi:hypothetical protein